MSFFLLCCIRGIGGSLLWFLINDHRLNCRGLHRLLKTVSGWSGSAAEVGFIPLFLCFLLQNILIDIFHYSKWWISHDERVANNSWPTSQSFLWITRDVSLQLCTSFNNRHLGGEKKNFTRHRDSSAICETKSHSQKWDTGREKLSWWQLENEHLQHLFYF